MELWLGRICSRDDYTHSVLIDRSRQPGRFLCGVIEDEHRNIKIAGETRIPAGHYQLELRTEGNQHKKYGHLFPEIHRGMIHLLNVPNFQYIQFHPGNDDDDTDGCLCPGYETFWTKNWLGRSTDAYRDVYPIIAGAIESGEQVWITVEDIA